MSVGQRKVDELSLIEVTQTSMSEKTSETDKLNLNSSIWPKIYHIL